MSKKAVTVSLTPPPLSRSGRGARRESLRDYRKLEVSR